MYGGLSFFEEKFGSHATWQIFYTAGRDLSGKPCYINMVLNYSAPEQPLAVRVRSLFIRWPLILGDPRGAS
jgi:hypothetical protein